MRHSKLRSMNQTGKLWTTWFRRQFGAALSLSGTQSPDRRRKLLMEPLEHRLALATVVGTDFQATGSLDYHTTDLTLQFDVPVLNANLPFHYQIRRAAGDAMLQTTDVPVNASIGHCPWQCGGLAVPLS